MNTLGEIIKNYLVSSKKIDPAKFDLPDLQVANLGLDSLDMVEMLFEVEDRCGFQLSNPMAYAQMTFAEMVADIEREVREHHGGELPDLKALKSHA